MNTEQSKNESQSAAEAFKSRCQTTAGILFLCMDVVCESDGKGGAFGIRYANGKPLPASASLTAGGSGSFFIGEACPCVPAVRHTVKKEGEEWAVVCYVANKRDEGRTYYASDKADAIETKKAMDQSAGLTA